MANSDNKMTRRQALKSVCVTGAMPAGLYSANATTIAQNEADNERKFLHCESLEDLIFGRSCQYKNFQTQRENNDLTVTGGEIIVTNREGYIYEVVKQNSSYFHVQTRLGVKLNVLPVAGRYLLRAWGLAQDGRDVGAALQKALDFLSTVFDHYEIDLTGSFATSIPLHIVAKGANNPKHISGELHIKVVAELGLARSILTITDNRQMVWRCHTYLDGNGEANNYQTRLADNGLVLKNSRHADLQYFHVYNVRNWGIVLENMTGDGDIQSFTGFGKVEVVDCGHVYLGKGEIRAKISQEPENIGKGLHNRQCTKLTVDALPDFIEIGDFIVIEDHTKPDGRYLYYIKEIKNKTIEVFPWIPPAVSRGHQIGFIKGGGVKISGNNSNLPKIAQVRSVRCAISLMLDHSFNAIVEFPYAQACNVPLMIGNSPSAAVHGAVILGFGSEHGQLSTFGPVMLTRAADSIMMQGYPMRDWIGLHRPRGRDGAFSSSAKRVQGIEMLLAKKGMFQAQWNEPRNAHGKQKGHSVIENGPKSHAYIIEEKPKLLIKWNEANNEDWGYGFIGVDWLIANSISDGLLTIDLHEDDIKSGWTIGWTEESNFGTSQKIKYPNRPLSLKFIPNIRRKKWYTVPMVAHSGNMLPYSLKNSGDEPKPEAVTDLQSAIRAIDSLEKKIKELQLEIRKN